MSLPNNALVLVLDGRKLLFLRNHGDADRIDLRTDAHEAREDARDRDIKSDLAGQSPGISRNGLGGGTMGETDYHQQAEDRFAKDAADELRKRALTNDFDALAIVAPPKALGELRKHLHKEVERRIVVELSKEMTGRPIADIEALFAKEAASPN